MLIDPRKPEHDVYGDRHVSERAGTIRTSLQSVPDTIDAHCADVREMVETVAEAMVAYYDLGATSLLIRGYDPLPDAVEYGEELIPRVRALVRDRDRAA